MENPQVPNGEASLTSFLVGNNILLSALGVLAGLATFFGSIPVEPNSPIVTWPTSLASLLMVIGTMLVLSELKSKFPLKPSSQLRAFKWVIILTYWLMVVFLLLKYRAISYILLSAGLLFTVGIPLARKFTHSYNSSLGFECPRTMVRNICAIPFLRRDNERHTSTHILCLIYF